uniref:Major facilitator superfamily (MFS) profile domain-containing protein n=1 Tax=Leptocylindrus danicus TaxID=163516 RepID=A0A7S2K957_9STRA|mmetsp:Transcript_20004/g.29808  ORF Transcript_20004/g.29808 Transcript_20004/m.29808 type:complete len:511 (+) Transcript_20004:715-2247(+)
MESQHPYHNFQAAVTACYDQQIATPNTKSTPNNNDNNNSSYYAHAQNQVASLEDQLHQINQQNSPIRNNKSFNEDARSTQTADGIADVQGYFIISLVVLIGDMSRGVMYPTLWPLVEMLGGTEVTQGFTVAAFSFGRILASPIFGERSVEYGYRSTLLLSCAILLLGTLLYAQSTNVGSTEFLILAQTTLGIGSGTLGVTRAYVADVTPTRGRTRYMAYLTAVQYGGFTVTPFIGAAFAHKYDNAENQYADFNVEKRLFVWNQYTAPAYFMSLVCVMTLVMLYAVFEDRTRDKAAKKKSSTDSNELANSLTWLGITVYDAAILGCMLLNVATKGCISSFETLGVNFALEHFGMDSATTGYAVSIFGAIGVVALLNMGNIERYLSDVQMIVFGIVIMTCASATLIGIREDQEYNMGRYLFVLFMVYSIGYPIGHTAVIGMFSKVVGRRRQGKLLGWFASAGSFSRMIFPIMSGYVAQYEGNSALFVVLVCVLATSLLFLVSYRDILQTFSR